MSRARKKQAAAPEVDDQVAKRRELRELRAAPPAPVRMVKRVCILDHPDGEVVVTIKGPAGAAKLRFSHTSISISTAGEPEEQQEIVTRTRPARAAAPQRQLSGNPEEPGGTITESLPGDDVAVDDVAFEFLRSMEKSEMRRAAQE